MAHDTFRNHACTPTSPADHAVIVTPNDDADLDFMARALLLSAAGVVRVTTRAGETVDLPLQAGYNPVSVSRVHATGTDVGLVIVALSGGAALGQGMSVTQVASR